MKIKTSFYSLDWDGNRYSNLQIETLDWKDEAEARMTYDLCQTEIIGMEILSEIPDTRTPAEKMLDEMKAGTFKLRPYSSFPRKSEPPLSADEIWAQDDTDSGI